MKRHTLATLAAVATALSLGACSSAVKLDDPAPVDDRNAAAGAAGAGGANGSARPVPGSDRPVAQVDLQPSKDPLNDPASPLAKRSVYFDFDSFSIRDDFRPVVDAHARYLVGNKTRRVVVQGNTDERGSREYNLALGQKRSEAVRRALTSLGVADTQIEAVSLGEEKPRATGTDEASFAENRRADIVYQ
ncbi:MAG TPA: peptidoglycan-associated lipoprotein Pal [Burkholderiaceae bacterium]|nr:peptidoglycan-associated lipoprotein Pal [Burkholderiaceae bacterium]